MSSNVATVCITNVTGDVRRGDEALLVGRQGSREVRLEELAELFDSVDTAINLTAGPFSGSH